MNSGTEAVMSALRVARGATGRAKILKFEGCYHGHSDSMLLRSGSGLAEAPLPDSAGLAPEVVQETLVAPLDDIAALETLFASRGSQIAAAIIEPLPANYGLLPQRPEFLQALARLTRAVVPSLDRAAILMELVAPSGPVYQAGTLSANPLAMCAGLAALARLQDGSIYRQLESLGARLERALEPIAPLAVQRVGSIFWPCISRQGRPVTPMRTPQSFPADAKASFAAPFHALLERGIYLAPSAFEVGFLSAAHTESQIDALAEALATALRTTA